MRDKLASLTPSGLQPCSLQPDLEVEPMCRATEMKQRLIERVRDRRAELDKLIEERRQRIAQQQQVQQVPLNS